MGKLNSKIIEENKEASTLLDGDGLRLVRGKTGKQSWVLRMVRNGKQFNVGLGPYPLISISKARQKAADTRRKIFDGENTIEERKNKINQKTFKTIAEMAIPDLVSTFRNKKHRDQWKNTIDTYVIPIIGNKPIDEIDHTDIVKCVGVIWKTKHETATRVKQRIKVILDWSVGRGHRKDTVSMGVVDLALPKIRVKANHHPALKYSEISEVFSKLLPSNDTIHLALAALILTAVRSGEIRGARIKEVDFENRVWTIPADRMKANVEHIVPLTNQVIEIFEQAIQMRMHENCDLIFQSPFSTKGINENSFVHKLRNLGFPVTAHGFRSTFRDWIADETTFEHEVAEMALAHTIPNSVERAYRRGNMLQKRRILMQAWADYCLGNDTSSVIPLKIAGK